MDNTQANIIWNTFGGVYRFECFVHLYNILCSVMRRILSSINMYLLRWGCYSERSKLSDKSFIYVKKALKQVDFVFNKRYYGSKNL